MQASRSCTPISQETDSSQVGGGVSESSAAVYPCCCSCVVCFSLLCSVYLTSRAIGQANITRTYIRGLKQDGVYLPDGPILMSPDRLMASFRREVIDRQPQIFKIMSRDKTNASRNAGGNRACSL